MVKFPPNSDNSPSREQFRKSVYQYPRKYHRNFDALPSHKKFDAIREFCILEGDGIISSQREDLWRVQNGIRVFGEHLQKWK